MKTIKLKGTEKQFEKFRKINIIQLFGYLDKKQTKALLTFNIVDIPDIEFEILPKYKFKLYRDLDKLDYDWVSSNCFGNIKDESKLTSTLFDKHMSKVAEITRITNIKNLIKAAEDLNNKKPNPPQHPPPRTIVSDKDKKQIIDYIKKKFGISKEQVKELEDYNESMEDKRKESVSLLEELLINSKNLTIKLTPFHDKKNEKTVILEFNIDSDKLNNLMNE